MKKHNINRISLSKHRLSGKKSTAHFLKIICWILMPVIITALLILDALRIYIFSTERLLVLGIGLLIILLPFFSEITLKGLTVKRDKTDDDP